MFSRILLQKNKIFNLRWSYALKRYLNETKLTDQTYQETVLRPRLKKKQQRESFLKNLLAGELDADIFSFPEQESDRHKDFINWLKPIETYMSSCRTNQTVDKKEVLSHLRELEVFRAHIRELHFGLELSKTELMRLTEVLTLLPWVGVYFTKNYVLPVELLYKYGSESQIDKYIPKIMHGEVVPTICVYEGDHRTNINDIKSFAVRKENSWVLNGSKTFVVNGINSHLFFVFARNGSEIYLTKPNSFSLFLVEKDFHGISVEDVYDTIGKHQTPFCKVTFNDTAIPANNVIGTPGEALNILLEYLKPGRQNISAQAISILRNFTNQLIEDVLKIKHFDKQLYTLDVVKHIIGEIIFSLYSMESMAYLTNGMIDDYENMDAEMENCITEAYCANKCLTCIQAGLQLIGAPSCMNNKSYLQALHDSLALTTIDINNLDANSYIPMLFLKHWGNRHHHHIYKIRNPLKFPLYNIYSALNKSELEITDKGYLHPSVEPAVKYLESCINDALDGILDLFTCSGSEITEEYTNLHRISAMLTELYAAYANLLRASRSYAIGVRNSDIERNISLTTACLAHHKISSLKAIVTAGVLYSGDHYYKVTMDLVYEKRKYILDHPLTRTY